MKIAIVGGGEFGYQLAKELHINHDITIIDIDEKVSERFSKLDVSFVHGNGATVKTLQAAKIESTDILIASTPSDEINIIACWTAKNLSKVETVCFVNHAEYIETFQTKDNKLLSQSQYNLDQIVWPKKALADELEKIISVPAAIDVESFVRGKVKLFEYRVKTTTPIVNKQLKDCNFPDDCIMIGLIKNDELYIPDGNTQLLAGDKTIFMGTNEALEKLSLNYFDRFKETKYVTIIGGGTVGYMLASKLENKNLDIKIVDNNEDRCRQLASDLKSTLVLFGDGTDLELLQAEQIGRSDVLVSVTNNDEKNLLCSLLGKQLGVKKVLTRVEKTANLRLFETVGIDVALSPQTSSVKEILNRLFESELDILAIVAKGKGEVLEITTSEEFEDMEVKDLNFPFKAVIGTIIRRKKVIVPKGNTVIRSGDRLIIFTTPNDSNRVKEFFEKFKAVES